jgi:hypothetical protein
LADFSILLFSAGPEPECRRILSACVVSGEMGEAGMLPNVGLLDIK